MMRCFIFYYLTGMIDMLIKKKNSLFGRYPSCDHLNNALRHLKDGDKDNAILEIIFAIEKANGYFHEDVASFVDQKRSEYWLNRHRN